MFSIYMRCVIGIECLFIFLITSSVQAQPRLEGDLQDAVVREGETVKFVCDLTQFIKGSYIIYWHYRGQESSTRFLSINRQVGISTPLSPQLEQRLSIIGNKSQDEFTLKITNVQVTDEGTYSCQYAVSEGIPETAGMARLTVLVPPSTQSPRCSVQPESRVVGDDVTLYCNSQAGKPTPNITYYRENERVAGPAISIGHQYQLTAQDNGVTFTCIMTTPALDKPRNCSVVPLRILPTVTILPAVLRVEEGTSTSFECNAEGVPSIDSYIWTVTNVHTGEVLPADRYTVSDNGRTLDITVIETIQVVCIVSVPSGLSGNSSKLVEVTERVQTTEIVGKGRTANPSPTGESSMSLIVPIAAVVGVVVIIMLIVLVILLRRRKKRRQPKIPIDSKDGFRMRVTEGEYDEMKPGQDGQTVGIGLPHEADSQGTVNGAEAFSGAASHSEPDTRAKANGKDVRSHVEPPAAAHQDIPMYAQLDKPKNAKKTEEVTGSEYSSVPVEEPEPTAADFGLVYADLDLQSPGTTAVDTGPASASEQTVYAMIRT